MSTWMFNYETDTVSLQPGDTVRVNHKECEAGVDNRRRLYITRTLANPMRLIWYCHNCQKGGSGNDSVFESYRDSYHKNNTIASVPEVFKEPANLVPDVSLWPLDAQVWAMKSGIPENLLKMYGIAHDPSTNRVYLPTYDTFTYAVGHNELVGYQLRACSGLDKRPKYLTALKDNSLGKVNTMLGYTSLNRKSKVVIVEDLLSGLAVLIASANSLSRFGLRVIVNYGAHISLDVVHKASTFDEAIVWLDNDSEHIKNKARELSRTIGLVNSNVTTILDYQDPKHYTDAEIREACGYN